MRKRQPYEWRRYKPGADETDWAEKHRQRHLTEPERRAPQLDLMWDVMVNGAPDDKENNVSE